MAVQVTYDYHHDSGEGYAGLSVVDPPHENDQFVMELLGEFLFDERFNEMVRKSRQRQSTE